MTQPQSHAAKPAAQSDRKPGGKLAFIGKAFVFFLTFGFAFPTLFGE